MEDMHVRRIDEQLMSHIILSVSTAESAFKTLPDDLDEEGAKKFIIRFIYRNIPPKMVSKDATRFEVEVQVLNKSLLNTNTH